jgi:ABC-type sugar transport system substrate-binding protein
MKRPTWLFTGAALVIGVLLGMTVRTRPHTDQPGVNAMRDRTYRMVVPFNSWPGWSVSARAMERMANAVPGVRTSLIGSVDGDSSRQIEEMDLLINQKVNGIILCPGDDPRALVSIINRAYTNGIPVVTMYDDVPDSERLTLVAADERTTARKFAKDIFKKLQGGAKPKIRTLVAYMGPGIANQAQRYEGIKEAVKDANEKETWIELIETPAEDKANEVIGGKEISAIWRRELKSGGIDLIIGLDARSAIGAITGLKDNGILKPGNVMVTGWDADEDVLLAIKDGWIEAVSAPNAGFMTQLATSVLEAYNLRYLYPDELGLRQMDMKALPPRINIEPIYIDRKNVDAFFRKK